MTRATSVLSLMNRVPDPNGRSTTLSGAWPRVGMFATSEYGAMAYLRSERLGSTSISSGSAATSSGISPSSESTRRSGKM